MTNETEQLRRLVDARERATKGEWVAYPPQSNFDKGQCSIRAKNKKGDMKNVLVTSKAFTLIESDANAAFTALSGTIDLRAILTRMEKMEAALNWYGDKGNHAYDVVPLGVGVVVQTPVDKDGGQRAREALE